jgi:hypothetical protein
MKILADTISYDWEGYLSDVGTSFYNAGYEFNVTDEGGLPKIEVKATDEDLPEIEIEAHDSHGEEICFTANLVFPEVITENQYPGHVGHCVNTWAKVAKVVDRLAELTISKE